ncbi:MAG: DUF2812 domain-containing protein [Sedimentibacter sp.]|uniref:DUF2812 domain-containing protein n=1 Tax=Sedimentibacter sp. TaxID=1960295 RepID=UPI002980ADBF|nr:DUF2812 domain-containing protein [Sedimentibacter sp.]MDW5300297.1 DUF2812 domain-containing protein [Sedimentibacter sp.]
MKSKTKWVLWGFFSLDYKAMGTYLEEMAEKGWMLSEVGRCIAKFRAIEPQKLKFYVDVFKGGGPLTPEKTEESEAYRNQCRESGWIFITSQDYLQFFYADGDSETVPIQTDEEIEQEIVKHTLIRNELRGICIFLIVAVFVLVRNIPLRYSNLLSFTGVTSTFLFPILCTFVVIPAVYSIIWMIKARRNIKKGISIAKPTLKSARRRIILFYYPTWIIILLFILSFIADAFFKPDNIVLALLGPVVGFIIGSGIRHLVKKNKIKRDSRALYIVISIILIIIFIPMIASLIIEGSEDIYKVNYVSEEYPIITMEEISKESIQGSVIREFKPGMSPVVPKHYTYWESENINGNNESMSIKYYKSINSYFAEVIFNGITEKLEKGMKWRGMTIFTKNIITDDEMKDLWDVDNMALTDEKGEIIIQKGNIVLHLNDFTGDMDFNDRQTRELIISRFFSDSSLEN